LKCKYLEGFVTTFDR